jgi:LAO/AO transport system kinase
LNTTRLSIQQYKEGILTCDRVILAKAITLAESSLTSDQDLATELIDTILPFTGNSIRIGITGVPGVGKSTFIEAFGKHLIEENKKLAILTIDPSSQLTRGSILGDKTRMESLSKNKMAFIRPSAAGETLGGVAHHTRETILLCEAAGFEVILIETVGVGQSEIAVKSMVDFFLLLMLAGAGDELQGIKKGIMEMANGIVITKADGDNINRATEAQAEYQQALHFNTSNSSGWSPKVLTCSSLTRNGIDDVWNMIHEYTRQTKASGYFSHHRLQQNVAWFNEYFGYLFHRDFLKHHSLQAEKLKLEKEVSEYVISPQQAAKKLFRTYIEKTKHNTSGY